MSNAVAGDIFERIIKEVVGASSADFEENGVSQVTLTELQQTWQQKLSSRNVAQMPWDPKPQPPPQQSATSSQSGTPVQAYPPSSQGQENGQGIKREPGYGSAHYAPQPLNPALAQQRAANHLAQQYGSQANASIDAMQQGGLALPGQQKPQGLQLPGQNQAMNSQQYAQQMKQQMSNQQPRIKLEEGQQDGPQYQQSPLTFAQTDGSGDAMDEWTSTRDAARTFSPDEIIQNDRTIREHVMQMSQTLESGLMQPLDQQRKVMPRKRKHTPSAEAGPSSVKPSYPAPFDGAYDDDEDKAGVKDEDGDENAINSDLDDSGDEARGDDDDDDDIDSMLCTYDKVQRVKNKWKCTLKDGVLSANGKEYLFHKAQGEFEW